ncbi:Uncharacterised protein [Stenotrophomonas maltophilia]|nr:Uncharacterised protein [Stenotrophomonas maltophilia]
MSRRVMVLVAASMAAALARDAARVQKAERVTHNVDVPNWTCRVRDPLPYGKKARRALRGGRHG